MNRFYLTGELEGDPVIRSARRTTVAGLVVVVHRAFTDREGHRREVVDHFPVVLFGPLAERVAILQAGDRVAVEGRLQVRTRRRRAGEAAGPGSIELVAERVELHGRPGVLNDGAPPEGVGKG